MGEGEYLKEGEEGKFIVKEVRGKGEGVEEKDGWMDGSRKKEGQDEEQY